MGIREEIEKIFLNLDNLFRSAEAKQKINKRLAYKWIYNKAREFYSLGAEKNRFDFNIYSGLFYLFNYNSKLFNENKLEHYDAFPLVFIIETNKDYFVGLNFHWVNIKIRGIILKRIIAAFPELFMADVRMVPLSYNKFKKILGKKFLKYCNYAIRRYRFDMINKIKGLNYLRINNTEMEEAIKYISPEYVGITYSDVFKTIKEKNYS